MLQTNKSELLEKLNLQTRSQAILALIKSPPFFVGVLIFGLIISSLFRTHQNQDLPRLSPMVPVLVTLVPHLKGNAIQPKFLKQIEIQNKELSAKQRLDRLTEDQIDAFQEYDLIARKNMAPHSILFLSDFTFKPKKSPKTDQTFRIIHPDQDNLEP